MVSDNATLTDERQGDDLLLSEPQLRFARRWREAVSNGPLNAVLVCDSDGLIVDVNPAACELAGCERQGLLGVRITELLPDVDGPSRALARVLGGETMVTEGQIRTDSGHWVEIESSSRLNGVAGRVLHLSCNNNTGRRQAEQELRARLRQQAMVARLGHDALAGLDLTELMQQIVLRVAELLGTEYSKVLELLPHGRGLLLRAGVGWKDGLVGRAMVMNAQAGYTLMAHEPVVMENLPAETRFLVPTLLADHGVISGVSLPIEVHGHAWGVLGAYTRQRRRFTPDDINFLQSVANVLATAIERKYAEQALREAKENYRGIFDDNVVGMFQSAPQGRFLSVNPACARMLGYNSPEDLIASITDGRQLYVDAKRYEEFSRLMRDQGLVENFEFQAYRKDGSMIWLRVHARACSPASFANALPLYHIGSVEDITEYKLLESELRQAQKLEAIGQLAAGVAHEINTPTQYVGDNTTFMQQSWEGISRLISTCKRMRQEMGNGGVPPETLAEFDALSDEIDLAYLLDEVPRALEQSLEGLQRVSKIVRAMKEFSHPGLEGKKATDINHAIDTTITVARNEWKYVADVCLQFDETLTQVPCLAGEFNQVILNLLVNAAHAIAQAQANNGGTKGTITITTKRSGEWAEIRIQDTGSGIPPEIANRVFEPFFTTKEVGKGTGQGLALAHNVIVKRHGGQIWFESEVGKGTAFFLRLPLESK